MSQPLQISDEIRRQSSVLLVGLLKTELGRGTSGGRSVLRYNSQPDATTHTYEPEWLYMDGKNYSNVSVESRGIGGTLQVHPGDTRLADTWFHKHKAVRGNMLTLVNLLSDINYTLACMPQNNDEDDIEFRKRVFISSHSEWLQTIAPGFNFFSDRAEWSFSDLEEKENMLWVFKITMAIIQGKFGKKKRNYFESYWSSDGKADDFEPMVVEVTIPLGSLHSPSSRSHSKLLLVLKPNGILCVRDSSFESDVECLAETLAVLKSYIGNNSDTWILNHLTCAIPKTVSVKQSNHVFARHEFVPSKLHQSYCSSPADREMISKFSPEHVYSPVVTRNWKHFYSSGVHSIMRKDPIIKDQLRSKPLFLQHFSPSNQTIHYLSSFRQGDAAEIKVGASHCFIYNQQSIILIKIDDGCGHQRFEYHLLTPEERVDLLKHRWVMQEHCMFRNTHYLNDEDTCARLLYKGLLQKKSCYYKSLPLKIKAFLDDHQFFDNYQSACNFINQNQYLTTPGSGRNHAHMNETLQQLQDQYEEPGAIIMAMHDTLLHIPCDPSLGHKIITACPEKKMIVFQDHKNSRFYTLPSGNTQWTSLHHRNLIHNKMRTFTCMGDEHVKQRRATVSSPTATTTATTTTASWGSLTPTQQAAFENNKIIFHDYHASPRGIPQSNHFQLVNKGQILRGHDWMGDHQI